MHPVLHKKQQVPNWLHDEKTLQHFLLFSFLHEFHYMLIVIKPALFLIATRRTWEPIRTLNCVHTLSRSSSWYMSHFGSNIVPVNLQVWFRKYRVQ